MDSTNHYMVQALYTDSLDQFTVNVSANDPVESEAAARLQALRDLLIASVTRIPNAAGP